MKTMFGALLIAALFSVTANAAQEGQPKAKSAHRSETQSELSSSIRGMVRSIIAMGQTLPDKDVSATIKSGSKQSPTKSTVDEIESYEDEDVDVELPEGYDYFFAGTVKDSEDLLEKYTVTFNGKRIGLVTQTLQPKGSRSQWTSSVAGKDVVGSFEFVVKFIVGAYSKQHSEANLK